MHWAALLPLSRPDTTSPIDAPALAVWALQFTPRVAVHEAAVLIEVHASLRLFGGAEHLHALVQAQAHTLGASLAWAPTGIGALALVRAGLPGGMHEPLESLLDPLPLERVTALAQHQATLAQLGCHTLGQVRQLPRCGMARRFGKPMLETLDQAYGLRPEVYDWVRVPERFQARLELMSRVDSAPALLFGGQRLLLQMAGWLQARQMGATAFTLRWCHDALRARDTESGGELTVRTAEPSQNVAHWLRLLAEHLAQVQLQAPVGDLELIAADVEPMQGASQSLLPETVRSGHSTQLALERIQSRLGPDSVRKPVLEADHRLEWAQRWACTDAAAPARAPAKGPTDPVPCLPLPAWVLDAPLRLPERAHRPLYQGPLQLLLGPDRIEGGWWHRTGAGEHAQSLNVQRDYWLARSPHAGLLWVFQTRLDGDEIAWFLHGYYG